MPSVVQIKHTDSLNTLSASVTLDSTPVPGNLLVAIATSHGTLTSPVYPWGGTPDANNPTGVNTSITSKIAGAGESSTVTISANIVRNWGLTVIEVAPDAGRTWVGVDRTYVGAGAVGVTNYALGPTALDLALADDFAAVGVAFPVAIAASSQSWSNGFTTDTAASGNTRGFAGHKVLNSSAAPSTTAFWTGSSNAAGVLATYKQTPPVAAFLALI